MTQSKDGNGHQEEYDPEVEFKYLDADVWIKTDAEGNQDVAYTDDVLKALEEEDDDESESDSDSE